ncbi:MAG: hypothetical protein GDA40_06290 [Rhodobacteraceae bacterium]|nr:hypothetical protein [Paracoccaceae bacterium]
MEIGFDIAFHNDDIASVANANESAVVRHMDAMFKADALPGEAEDLSLALLDSRPAEDYVDALSTMSAEPYANAMVSTVVSKRCLKMAGMLVSAQATKINRSGVTTRPRHRETSSR